MPPPLRRFLAALLVLAIAVATGASSASAHENGKYPLSALSHIYPGSNSVAYLAKEGHVSADFNTFNLCANADGVPIAPGPSQYTPAATAYRSLPVQKILRAQLGHNAAPIVNGHGTSNHGTGHAIDLATLAMRRYIDAHGGAFGISKATSDASWEWWHLVVHPELVGFHRPDPGGSFRFPTLRRGSGGKCQAPAVQELRRRLGLKSGDNFGNGTERAVKKFQRRHHLKPDGIVGSKTWLAVRKADRGLKKTNPRNVGAIKGATAPTAGQDVRAVQGLLNGAFKTLHRPRRVTVDGVAGPGTIAAIKRFQQLKGLPVTGVVDDKTYAVLLKTQPPPTPRLAISAEGVKFIAGFEGFRRCAYLDRIASPPVWTVGYGHTSNAGGLQVGPNTCLKDQQAGEFLLRGDLDRFGKAVIARLKAPTSTGQYNAQVSFSFNVGLGGWGTSTLLVLHNDRQYLGAARQFKRWDHAGGRVVAGLTRRRRGECEMYVRGSSVLVQRARPC